MLEVLTGVVNLLLLFAWLRLGPIRTHASKQDQAKITPRKCWEDISLLLHLQPRRTAEHEAGIAGARKTNKEW